MTDSQRVSATARVDAHPRAVFALLRSPSAHALIDGSGTVLGSRAGGPAELNLGDRFHMSMRRGIPYRMWNTVVEFEPDRLIAWRQEWGHHVWRYILEPSDGGTLVTETFGWSSCRAKWLIHAMHAPREQPPGDRSDLGAIAAPLPRGLKSIPCGLYAPRLTACQAEGRHRRRVIMCACR